MAVRTAALNPFLALLSVSNAILTLMGFDGVMTATVPPTNRNIMTGGSQALEPSLTVDYNYAVREGDNVTMSCDKEGDVVWNKESTGEIIARRGTVESSQAKYSLVVEGTLQILTITKVSLAESDVYGCFTLFGPSDRHIVDVQVPPEGLRIEASSQSVNEGRFGTLTCVSAAAKPSANLTWTLVYADGSSIPVFTAYETQITHSNGTITKSSEVNEYATRELFGASYICNASVTTPTLTYSSSVNVDLNITLTPGETYLSGFDTPAVEGRMKRLTCHARDALPAAELRWYWDNDFVNGNIKTTRNENGTIDTENTLEFTPRSHHAANHFRCEIVNDVMRDIGVATIRLEREIDVHYKPIINVDLDDRLIWEDNTDTLECTVDSNPVPTDSGWLHNGQRVVNDSKRIVSGDTTRPTLTFTDIDSSDKGLYQCISSNIVGITTSNNIIVTVLHAPLCQSRQKYKYGVAIGDTVTVVCHVEAFPSNNVIFGWNYNGSWTISDGVEHDDLNDIAYSSLNYTVRNESDYKQIEIQASNGVLTMKENCHFHILPPGPAEAPNDCEALNVTSSSIAVSCWEEFDGGSQTHYTLGAVLDGNFVPLLNQTSLEFDLTNVVADTQYTLQVCASNKEFWSSTRCTASFTVTTLSSNDTVTQEPLPLPLSANAPFIAGGVVGGLLLFVIIAAIIAAAVHNSNKNKSKAEEPEEGKIEVPPSMPTADTDAGQHEMEVLDKPEDIQTDLQTISPVHEEEALRHLEEATDPEYEPEQSYLSLELDTAYQETTPNGDDAVSGGQGTASDGGQANPCFDENGDSDYDQADGMLGVTSAKAACDDASPAGNGDVRDNTWDDEYVEPDQDATETPQNQTGQDEQNLSTADDITAPSVSAEGMPVFDGHASMSNDESFIVTGSQTANDNVRRPSTENGEENKAFVNEDEKSKT